MVSPSALLRPLSRATDAFLSQFTKGLAELAAGYRPESAVPGPQEDHVAQATGGTQFMALCPEDSFLSSPLPVGSPCGPWVMGTFVSFKCKCALEEKPGCCSQKGSEPPEPLSWPTEDTGTLTQGSEIPEKDEVGLHRENHS